jgi:hypothetical protein
MTEERQYNGYTLFDDIQDKDLQAHNRAVVMRNISVDMGDQAVKAYCEMIPHSEQLYVIGKLSKLAGMK